MDDFETNKRLLQTLLRGWGVDLTPRGLYKCGVYTWANKARAGDQIAVRSVVNGTQDVIWHHGIYVGDEHMVHMHPNGNINKVHIDQFMAGLPTANTYVEEVGVVQYQGDNELARAQTVIAAHHALQDKAMQSIVYNIVEHQCDGFATWCRTGKWVSSAINALLVAYSSAHPPLPYQHHHKCA